MKQLRSFLHDARRHKGLALIIVLSMLALATIVILAFLSVADTEHKGTMTYSASQSARRLADTAVNVVISQIRAGSDQDGDALNGREFHATQPGAVRQYSAGGNFLAGYKLFSDSMMIFTGDGKAGAKAVNDEREFVKGSEPPADWNIGNQTARYVDLNDPVVKGVLGAKGEAASAQIFFPVIDPRAAYNMNPDNKGLPMPVEGFSYETTTAISGNDISAAAANANGVRAISKPPGSGPDSLRLAMPVQWLYMLRDGTLGTLDSSLEFQAEGIEPTETNPIVGRLAFWTDDETCKININTASEPTFQGQPTYYHDRDRQWADYGAARNEYQRFPGHPATVALSSVFYPNPYLTLNRSLDNYTLKSAETDFLTVKNRIYQLVPRIQTGGSEAGTKAFAADNYDKAKNGLAKDVDLASAMNERLYASVDELFFSQLGGGNSFRTANTTDITGGKLFDKSTLERSSAFLTAHSRASEISMLGLPKIAMWPVDVDSSKRTGFDNLIEFCSRLGDANSQNTYVFQRQIARSDTNDIIQIPRNAALLSMLDNILSTAIFPAETSSGAVGNKFSTKMKSANGFDNYRQVIVEMFDYIRSTNLHDSYLVPDRDSWQRANINYGENGNATALNIYDARDSMEDKFKTFTPGVVKDVNKPTNPFDDRALPGHGQVTPSLWSVGGKSYRGFGRSVSISEIGIQFICTGDGQPDMYSWRHAEYDPNEKKYNLLKVPMTVYDSNITDELQADPLELKKGARNGSISGGRTALRVVDTEQDYFIDHGPYKGPLLSNALDEWWRDEGSAEDSIKKRYYSNFPKLKDKAFADVLYDTKPVATSPDDVGKLRENHPGTQEENWNYTLAEDTPLGPSVKTDVYQKRVQALIHLEFFCPSVGYTQIFPEFTIVMNGAELSSIRVDGVIDPIFSKQGFIVLKSSNPIYNPASDGTPQVGGYASFRRLASGRHIRGIPPMPEDEFYVGSNSPAPHANLINMDLVSDFFTVPALEPMKFQSGLQPLSIRIYDSHDWTKRKPVQTIYFKLPETEAGVPPPDLVTQPTHREEWIEDNGDKKVHPTVQAPHWWAFHRGGALGRFYNDPLTNPNYVPGRLQQVPGGNVSGVTAANGRSGRQRYPGSSSLIYGYENTDNFRQAAPHENRGDPFAIAFSRTTYKAGTKYNRMLKHPGSDVIRTLQPGHGDARLIFAKNEVLATDWSKHPLYTHPTAFLAHNFSSYSAGSEPGFDRSGDPSLINEDPTKRVLPQTIDLGTNLTPDAPYAGTSSSDPNPVSGSLSPAFLAQRYFDFDDSDPGGRVGTFINKPDEGNYAVGEFQGNGWPKAVEWRASYFRADGFGARFAAGARSFFSPNRMISSPVMMGSLPSRIFSDMSLTDAAQGGNGAWTNLLFRPHLQLGGTASSHPGQVTPPDHYLLDLFWMPVVEPYAISEPLSTAGKVNMNYQMIPFTHIRRATAIHAAMKAEVFAALPNVEHSNARRTAQGFGNQGLTQPKFYKEDGVSGEKARWHRNIALDRFANPSGAGDQVWWTLQAGDRVQATLRQFEERFNFAATVNGKGPSGIGSSSKVNDGLPSNFRSGLFRSASQICELHLIPSQVNTAGGRPAKGNANAVTSATENVTAQSISTYKDRNDAMQTFWQFHSSTGDNTRERPYSNLYAKLTTRSNTFRVHVRAQTLKKAVRGPNIKKFNPAEDEVTGEFRGSFLLERYIDRADLQRAGTDADFTDGNTMDEKTHPPLDSYYRFRVLESKRFAP